jgi:chemotaxis response regulator CheB
MQQIKVVVVDDSALVRSLLTEIINQQPDMRASVRRTTRCRRAR